MRFLTDESCPLISDLIRKCKSLRWAVTWASKGFNAFEVLKTNEEKIEQLIVGLHFYQTHPDFIEAFMSNEGVRFKMSPAGVFHPKVYLFEHEHGEWDCFVGSENFTKMAFSLNQEALVHFNHNDLDATSAHAAIDGMLIALYAQANAFNEYKLAGYQTIWKRQQRHLEHVSGNYSDPLSDKKNIASRSPLETAIFKMNWQEYFKMISIDNQHSIDGRLCLLEEAQKMFRQTRHFVDFDYQSRRGIGGLKERKEIDWKWFGSMVGSGKFKNLIKDNSSLVSEALDAIPIEGIVTQEHFEKYLKLYLSVMGNEPLATATRLLAMKRPDYFVCLDSKNLELFKKDFGIHGAIHIADYWTRVIQRIQDSNWWNSPEPEVGTLEQRIWKCRTAFLDVPWYQS